MGWGSINDLYSSLTLPGREEDEKIRRITQEITGDEQEKRRRWAEED